MLGQAVVPCPADGSAKVVLYKHTDDRGQVHNNCSANAYIADAIFHPVRRRDRVLHRPCLSAVCSRRHYVQHLFSH